MDEPNWKRRVGITIERLGIVAAGAWEIFVAGIMLTNDRNIWSRFEGATEVTMLVFFMLVAYPLLILASGQALLWVYVGLVGEEMSSFPFNQKIRAAFRRWNGPPVG